MGETPSGPGGTITAAPEGTATTEPVDMLRQPNDQVGYAGKRQGAKTSIGSLDVVEDNQDARAKGGYSPELSTVDELGRLGKTCLFFRDAINSPRPSVSRFTMKAFMESKLATSNAPELDALSEFYEAPVPTVASDGTKFYMQYLGYNKDSRRITPNERVRYLKNLSTARSASNRRDMMEDIIIPIARDLKKGGNEYVTPIIDGNSYHLKGFNSLSELQQMPNGKDMERSVRIFLQGFKYSGEAVDDLLNNPNNRFTLMLLDNKVVGMQVMEHGTKKLAKRDATIKIAEMTDTSLAEDVPKWLYDYMSSFTVLRCLRDDNAQLIFTETNLENERLLIAAYSQGRQTSVDVALEFGGKFGDGIMVRHAPFGVKPMTVCVTYFPQDTMDRLRSLVH